MPVAAKNCMCPTPPAPTPAVSPHPRSGAEVVADVGLGADRGGRAGGVAHIQSWQPCSSESLHGALGDLVAWYAWLEYAKALMRGGERVCIQEARGCAYRGYPSASSSGLPHVSAS